MSLAALKAETAIVFMALVVSFLWFRSAYS